MPGESLDDALGAVDALAAEGIPAVLTQLGENVDSAADVRQVVDHYRGAVDRIVEGELDVHLSIKPTHLGLDLGGDVCRKAVDTLRTHASEGGVPLWIDMEDSSYLEATLDLYHDQHEPGSAFGICLQAYLHRTPDDLEKVLEAGGWVRLVKGAYREAPEVAIQSRREVDEAFLALGRRLAEATPGGDVSIPLRHVLGSHDMTLLAQIPDGPEVQMLYGIRTGAWPEVQEAGTPFRVLISYGEHWYPWYMRRLAERPANVGFLVRSLLPGGG
jgi:proline dehydrogenase